MCRKECFPLLLQSAKLTAKAVVDDSYQGLGVHSKFTWNKEETLMVNFFHQYVNCWRLQQPGPT